MWIELLTKLLIAGAVLIGVLSFGGLLTWVERKQSALMQDRIGANRASILGFRLLGLFHIMTDGIKMFTKEEFIPRTEHRVIFILSPFLAWFFSLLAFAIIPFTPELTIGGYSITIQVANPEIGVLVAFAMMGMAIYGVVLGGWASNNNYALLGSMRATAQLISYEVALAASAVGPLLIYGTLNMQDIVIWQGRLWNGWLPLWGIVVQPLAFLLFLIAGAAETKRIPFDLPEGESEIIGFNLEYSSMRFGAFMFTDFIEKILVACLTTSIFLGGWQVPWLADDGFRMGGELALGLGPVAVWLLRAASFGLKVCILIYVLMLVRWTLPRFRYDQLMNFGWKFLLPLAFLNIIVTAAVLMVLNL
ncbi:MAG: NADH-quinone oxidoreductase subunit H [Candidatus Glassbacteria bacterium]|nr:NADH-quinone oxidoreductase subunit H [Candidatus Glassbacteria bacterium]